MISILEKEMNTRHRATKEQISMLQNQLAVIEREAMEFGVSVDKCGEKLEVTTKESPKTGE